MIASSVGRTVARAVAQAVSSVGGSSGPPVPSAIFELQSSGSLFVPAMDSLADWTTAEAPWSAVAQDGFVCAGGIDRTFGDARYADGRRNPLTLIDGDTLYHVSISFPSATPCLNFIEKSTDMGRSWIYLGQMSEANAKIGGGTWAGCACPGWIEKRGSTYYFHRGLSDTQNSPPPYGWDIWSATDIDVPNSGKFGDWSAVRTISAGTGWASTDLLPGSTVLFEGTYYNFAQAYSGDWVIGLMSSSTPDGVFAQVGSTALFGASDFGGRAPENPRVFLHTGIGKYVMLVNLIAIAGTHTDANAVVVGTDDPTDWTGASIYINQFIAPNHGTNAIGMLAHFSGIDNTLQYDTASNDFPIVYDTDATDFTPSWHTGRRVIAAVMRYSAGEYPFAGAGVTYLKRTLAHTDLTVEFQVKFDNNTGGNSMGISFRRTGSSGYVLGLPNNACALLLNAAFGLVAAGSGAAPKIGCWNYVKLVVVGTSIKIWLNGELQVNATDATYASGTDVWLYQANVQGAVRDIRISAGDAVSFTGLQERQVITLRGPGDVCLDEVVADAGGEASYTGNFIGIQSGEGSIAALVASEGSVVELTNPVSLPVISAASAFGGLDGTTLSVTATDVTVYRWQFKDGSVWRNLQGLDSADESLANEWGTFRCLVSNSVGCIATEELVSSMVDGANLYLDSDRGLYTERTGASATTVTTDGNPVGTWRDTVHTHNFVATSDGVRPTLSGGSLALSGSYLVDTTCDELANKSALTVIVECSRTGGANHLLLWQADVFGIQWYLNELIFYVGTGQAKLTDVDTAVRTIKAVFDGSQTGDANRFKVYFDDVLQSLTFPVAIPTVTANTLGLAIGDLYGSPGTAPWTGTIKKLIVF